jgi:anti-sigma-K factor RskA
MIPQDPREREVLAGEYVLGVLDLDQAREIETALATDEALRDAIAFWERKLHPLSSLAEPVNPPAEIWNAVEARIARPPKPSRNVWAAAAPWRWSTGAFAAIAAALLLYVVIAPRTPAPITSPLVAVLKSSKTQSAGWIAVLGPNGLRLSQLTGERPPAAHAYELWGIVPRATRPVPLGVIPASGEMRLAALPKGVLVGATLAISIEPPGGSPTGLPTGPVVYAGVLRST